MNEILFVFSVLIAIASITFLTGLVVRIAVEAIDSVRKKRFKKIMENCKTITIEGETVVYTPGKTCAEIIADIEKKKAPRRVRHLAFSAKKFRVRKKNRARLKKYE